MEETEVARDRAVIRTDMWASPEWRKLSTGAQWLYMYLLSAASLSYVGIADWRPARIAAKVGDANAAEIAARAAELEAGRFVFIDDDTEEALIRSFLRHDGLLRNPNLWRAVGNDFADASSEMLRGIIAAEAQRLQSENPDGFETAKGGTVNPWQSKYLATLFDTPPVASPAATAPEPAASATTTTAAVKAKRAAARSRAAELEAMFDAAYEAWPKKTEKKRSLAKFLQLTKSHDADWLVDQIKRFGAAYRAHVERQFTPALSVWLNGERWTDELPSAEASKPSGPDDSWMFRGRDS